LGLRGVEWRKLHNEELSDSYSSPNIIRAIKSRIIRGVRHVTRIGDRTGAFWASVGKSEENRPLGRPRSRRKYNIKWLFKK